MGTEYTWGFDQSFLIFLLIVFASLGLAVKLKSIIPMPLIYGILFVIGFGTGVLPTDMILSANMIAVGTIAFNVLVVHSGTMINIGMLRKRKNEVALCVISSVVLVLVVGVGMTPVIGKGLAFIAPGSVIGGGASCAIASRWILDKNPQISVFPWLIFMFQGLFSVPIVTWALKRESKAVLQEFRERQGQESTYPVVERKKPFCQRVPEKYKNTAYYLGMIMIVTVVNNLLHSSLLSGLHMNPNITALLFGLFLGSLGFMDKAPLFKSDSYGLLLLGLMGLMANTIAKSPWQALVGFLPPLILVFVVSTVVLILCGVIGAKLCGFRAERGIALTMNCMMGFPVNDMLIANGASIGETEEEKGYIKSQTGPVLGIGTMLISNAVSVVIVSIMVIFV